MISSALLPSHSERLTTRPHRNNQTANHRMPPTAEAVAAADVEAPGRQILCHQND